MQLNEEGNATNSATRELSPFSVFKMGLCSVQEVGYVQKKFLFIVTLMALYNYLENQRNIQIYK